MPALSWRCLLWTVSQKQTPASDSASNCCPTNSYAHQIPPFKLHTLFGSRTNYWASRKENKTEKSRKFLSKQEKIKFYLKEAREYIQNSLRYMKSMLIFVFILCDEVIEDSVSLNNCWNDLRIWLDEVLILKSNTFVLTTDWYNWLCINSYLDFALSMLILTPRGFTSLSRTEVQPP